METNDANGVTTYLLYDGWSLIEERDAGDNVLASYIHGAAIDEILVRNAGSSLWYHHDGLGSTTALTDSGGLIAESYSYDVYGAVSVFDATGSPLTTLPITRFLFTGREYLADLYPSSGGLALYDYRNRFYSPALGRFVQPDPIRFAAGDENFYRYVWNEPVTWTDASGLKIIVQEKDVKAYKEAKDHLKGTAYGKSLQDLEDSPNEYKLVPNNEKRTYFFDTLKMIAWDPTAGLKSPYSDACMSPSVAMGHEVDHALAYDRNPDAYYRRSSVKDPEYDDLEERRNITGPENETAKKLGQLPRFSHNKGEMVRVATPTSTVPLKEVK